MTHTHTHGEIDRGDRDPRRNAVTLRSKMYLCAYTMVLHRILLCVCARASIRIQESPKMWKGSRAGVEVLCTDGILYVAFGKRTKTYTRKSTWYACILISWLLFVHTRNSLPLTVSRSLFVASAVFFFFRSLAMCSS